MSPILLVVQITVVLLVFGLFYYTILNLLPLPEPVRLAILVLSVLGAIMALLHFSGAILW